MSSFIRRISDFFGRIFSFGHQLLSQPFFDHVFAIAGLIYPPAAPIVEAVDRLFEQDTREGFEEQLDVLLTQSGLDNRQSAIIRHLVGMLFLSSGTRPFADEQKAALARDIIKSAIASDRGQFRTYNTRDHIEKFCGLKIRGLEDRDAIPDHLVNFSLELSLVQRKFNRMLDRMIAYTQAAMQPLFDAGPGEIEQMLEDGRRRGWWQFTAEDYKRPEVRKAVAAALARQEAVEEGMQLWGRPVESPGQIPDCLVNFAVEACYANSRIAVMEA